MNTFVNWLNQQIELRGWCYADIAKRGHISNSSISKVINDQSRPGIDFCRAVARAFNLPDDQVMRRAGLLDPLPPEVEDERTALTLFRRLDHRLRGATLIIMQNLLGIATPDYQTINEQPASYHADDPPRTFSEHLANCIVRDLPTMHPDDQQIIIDLMESLRNRRQNRERGPDVAVDATS